MPTNPKPRAPDHLPQVVRLGPDRNEALILYMAPELARVVCDRKCGKAWGINNRPQIQLSADPDDVVLLADDELGEAPADPGTYEGGCGKPASPDEFPQKWCVRECERSSMSVLGEWPEPMDPPDWSRRHFNMPHLHPEESHV
jgi:hypothetical protein